MKGCSEGCGSDDRDVGCNGGGGGCAVEYSGSNGDEVVRMSC